MQFRCGLVRWRLPWQRLRCARWAVLCCGAIWLSGPARASEPAPLQAQIEWQAAACGKASDFVARVARRTRHVRFSASAEQLRLQVRIEPSAGALRAEVTLQGAGKAPVVRRIQSPDCEDALDALALVAAIGIDQRWRELWPRRQGTRRPGRKPQPPQAPVEPAGAERGPDAPVVALAEVTLSAAPPAPPQPVRAVAPPVAMRPAPLPVAVPPPWSWAVGVGARVTGGVAPESLLGGELWLRAGWERGSPLSPELGLSLLQEQSRDFERPEGQADFALRAAALELCPLRVGSRRLRVQPCAVASFGWLWASGHQTFRAHTQSSPWSSLGAGAQAAGALGPVALRLAASLAHPLRRDRYGFEPGDCSSAQCDAAPFHRVSAAVWSIALGAGLSMP